MLLQEIVDLVRTFGAATKKSKGSARSVAAALRDDAASCYESSQPRKQKSPEAGATLRDIEKASMSWFRHAAERAAAQRRTMLEKDSTFPLRPLQPLRN